MYHLTVLTPEKVFFEDDIKSLIAPGAIGYLGVLSHHAPLLTTLKAGLVTITDQNQKQHTYHISGGVLEVKNNQAFLLVDTIEPESDNSSQ